jgi:hypothetical protein
METVLAGTGGCTAYDVVLILKRGRHDVRGCQVKVTAERAEQDPKVFTRIQMHFVSAGAACRQRRWSAPSRCRTSVLLGQHHAGQDGPDHDQLRADRGLRPAQMRWAVVVITLAAPRINQVTGAGRAWPPAALRLVGVAALVVLHGRHDGTRAQVSRRQAVQMAGQVLLDLAFGLDHESPG